MTCGHRVARLPKCVFAKTGSSTCTLPGSGKYCIPLGTAARLNLADPASTALTPSGNVPSNDQGDGQLVLWRAPGNEPQPPCRRCFVARGDTSE
jgi:hypothetical protein